MQDSVERLGKDIGGLSCCGNVFNIDFADVVDFANIMVTTIDVLCAWMIDVVLDMFESGVGVGFDKKRPARDIEFEGAVSKRRRKIASFAASVSAMYSDSIVDNATVVCLCELNEMHPLASMNT